MEQTDILIIGTGIAAVSAADAAVKQNPSLRVTAVSAEHELPYYRLRLCERLKEHAKNLMLHPAEWYEERGIGLLFGKKAVRLLPDEKAVLFDDGSRIHYGKLIIATGSKSFIPPIEGADGAGVYSLWTMEDSEAICRAADKAKRAAVIGGGLLGLETAHQLAEDGLKVYVIESFPRLLGRQTDTRASGLFKKKTESFGIEVMLGASTTKISGTEGALTVRLSDGREIEVDFVVVSTGVHANTDWLEGSGIAINRRIVVNSRLETSLPDVYAAGDVAVQDGQWYGLWSVSMAQGKTAGTNAAGGDASYNLTVPPYVLNTMGTSLAAGGLYPDEPQPFEELEADEETCSYRRVIYAGPDKEGPVTGYILLGNIREYQKLQKRLIK